LCICTTQPSQIYQTIKTANNTTRVCLIDTPRLCSPVTSSVVDVSTSAYLGSACKCDDRFAQQLTLRRPGLNTATVFPTASNIGLPFAIARVVVMGISIVTSSQIKSTSGAGLLPLAVHCIIYSPACTSVDMLEFKVTGKLPLLWPSRCMDKSTVSTGKVTLTNADL